MMKRLFLVPVAVLLSVSLIACGGSGSGGNAQPANTPAATASSSVAASPESAPAAEAAPASDAAADLTTPSVVIESGDMDGISALAKQMQNFEVAEGTVIKITGLFVKNTSTPSIMEASEDGTEKVGLSLFLDEGIEEPADETPVEAVGVAVKGTYFMEFHVSADGFKVLS